MVSRSASIAAERVQFLGWQPHLKSHLEIYHRVDIALDAFPFLRRFHDIVISGDLKILKPDPRIYAALIERRRFDPARAFFIDDNERNVAAARRLGGLLGGGLAVRQRTQPGRRHVVGARTGDRQGHVVRQPGNQILDTLVRQQAADEERPAGPLDRVIGRESFDIDTAGAATLVLQAVAPVLATAAAASRRTSPKRSTFAASMPSKCWRCRNRSESIWRARKTSSITARAAWWSSSRRGISRWPF